jgi:hypothetical protein
MMLAVFNRSRGVGPLPEASDDRVFDTVRKDAVKAAVVDESNRSNG